MISDSVSARYAEALFETSKSAGQIDAIGEELGAIARMLRDEAQLRELLLNPDVEIDGKIAVLTRLLGGSMSDGVRAFARLVLSFDRASQLADMAAAYQELVDRDRRLLRVRVKTARPLADALRSRLQQWLENREGGTIELSEEIDPKLIGGLQIFLDHRILDGSISTQLATLRHRLKQVRVH